MKSPLGTRNSNAMLGGTCSPLCASPARTLCRTALCFTLTSKSARPGAPTQRRRSHYAPRTHTDDIVSPSWVFGKQQGATPASLPRRSPRLATLACDEVGAPATEAAAAADDDEEEEEECMPVGYIERTKAGAHSSFMERKLQQLNAVAAAPLGSDLLVHRSKLEQAKADADAKARAGLAEARKAPTSTMAAVAGSLGADLRIHKSKLELAKEAAIAAKAACASTPGRGAKRGRDEADGTSSLTDMKIHKSGLERAKEAASGLPTTPAGARKAATQSRAAQKLAAEWGAWDGQPMDGLLKRHESKLEKDAKAWKAMAAKQ